MSVHHRRSFAAFFFVVALGGFLLVTQVAEIRAASSWPESLTLEKALDMADEQQPDILIAAAQLEIARAEGLRSQALTGLQARLETRLRWIQPPSIATDQSQQDHRLSLFLSKNLYDFGRSAAEQSASEAQFAGQQQRYQDAINQYRLAVMQAFFEAVLSDQAYVRDNEDMAVAYIIFDRAQNRNELGQVSDIELLKANSDYQAVRVRRYQSDMRRRITRAQLANLLNRPGDLPSELSSPGLPGNVRSAPDDVAAWQQEAENNNPVLVALRKEVSRAQNKLDGANAFDNPTLSGEVEVSEYSRGSAANDQWRAGVTLNVPLITGGFAKAERARYRAELRSATAQLEKARRALRQQLLENWSRLQTLKVVREREQARGDYRELYLDRSRALYELEVKSDLGDAMTQTSAARYEFMRTEFDLALTWGRIEALLGRRVAGSARAADVSGEKK